MNKIVISIILLFITFYTECVAQPYEGRRTYSMTELKRNKWVNLEFHEGHQYSKEVVSYTDTEEMGVYAFGGKLNVRPAYQREFVYDDKKRNLVIDSVASGIDLGKMYWSINDDGTYELLDGQQRTISICQYCSNAFSMEFESGVPQLFVNLDAQQKKNILLMLLSAKV